MLRYALLHKYRKSLVYSGMRGLASESAQDEYNFETLTGNLEGKIICTYIVLYPPSPRLLSKCAIYNKK